MIDIYFPSLISEIIKVKKTSVEANNLSEAFNKIFIRFGHPLKKILLNEKGEINRYIKIYLNGKEMNYFDFNNILLKDGDKISFLIIISGG